MRVCVCVYVYVYVCEREIERESVCNYNLYVCVCVRLCVTRRVFDSVYVYICNSINRHICRAGAMSAGCHTHDNNNFVDFPSTL